MATMPPTDSMVHVKEDPDSLALRARLAVAEEKLAAAAEAMNATQRLLTQALAPAPVTNAELWRGFANAVLAGGPVMGWSASEYAAQAADKMLTEYRKRYPA